MLAIIAGQGRLPGLIAGAQPAPPLICALAGFEPEGIAPDLVFRLETLGTLLQQLQARGVTEICLAGAVRRPPVDPAAIDTATRPLIPRLTAALSRGDDGALRAVVEIFEAAGFAMRAAQELRPDLLPEAGCLSSREPSEEARADSARGAEIVAALSAADVGQGCVVLKRQALAIESAYGTDWMLASLTARPDTAGGVLVKMPKDGQDRRVDLPTIGVTTVEAAAQARLDGITIEAGGVLVLDRDAVRAACDRLGLFLWVREAAG